MTHYGVLDVPMDADDQLIRSAFRTLARRYHPDAGEGSSPEEFRRLVEAYETLIDPTRRQAYDRSLRPAPPPRPTLVESMISPVEPLVRRSPYSVPLYASARFARTTAPFDQLFDELWHAIEDDFSSRWP